PSSAKGRKPAATSRARALPRGVLERRAPAADRDGWPLGHAPSLSGTPPAAPATGDGGIHRPDQNPPAGSTPSPAQAPGRTGAGILVPGGRQHPATGTWHQRAQPAGGAGAPGQPSQARGKRQLSSIARAHVACMTRPTGEPQEHLRPLFRLIGALLIATWVIL